MFLHVVEHVFLYRWWHLDVDCSLIGWHKMSITHDWVTHCHVWCVYETGIIIPFSKLHRYVTNHLYLYATNYYSFVFTVSLLLLTMCLSLVNVKILLKTITTIIIWQQISTGPMDLFFIQYTCIYTYWMLHATVSQILSCNLYRNFVKQSPYL